MGVAHAWSPFLSTMTRSKQSSRNVKYFIAITDLYLEQVVVACVEYYCNSSHTHQPHPPLPKDRSHPSILLVISK